MSNGNFELIMNKIENLVETREHSYYNLDKIPELFNGSKTKDVSLLEFHSFAKQLHYYCNFYNKFIELRKKRTDKDTSNKSLFELYSRLALLENYSNSLYKDYKNIHKKEILEFFLNEGIIDGTDPILVSYLSKLRSNTNVGQERNPQVYLPMHQSSDSEKISDSNGNSRNFSHSFYLSGSEKKSWFNTGLSGDASCVDKSGGNSASKTKNLASNYLTNNNLKRNWDDNVSNNIQLKPYHMEPIQIKKNLLSNTQETSMCKATTQSEDVFKISCLGDEDRNNRLEALKYENLPLQKNSTTEEMIQKWDSSDSRMKSFTNFDNGHQNSVEVYKKTLSQVDVSKY